MEFVLLSNLVVRVLYDVCFKLSVKDITFSASTGYVSAFKTLGKNKMLWLGIALSIVNFLLWVNVLSYYDLSFAYPLLGVYLAAIMVVGRLFFNESLDKYKLIGIGLILISSLILVME